MSKRRQWRFPPEPGFDCWGDEFPPPWHLWAAPCPRCGGDVKAKASKGWTGIAQGHRCQDETAETNPKMRMVELVKGARISPPHGFYTAELWSP